MKGEILLETKINIASSCCFNAIFGFCAVIGDGGGRRFAI